MNGFENLEIYQMAYRLAIETHKLSLSLPKYELYEQGSQIRRSSKRIKDTIAEGYGRRRYKDEYIRFLIYAHASCDETISHINMINDIYYSDDRSNELLDSYKLLGKKINSYIQYVESNWRSVK